MDIFLDDPKILIGQSGQTLVELQQILKIILNKKLAAHFYVNLDINNYKTKKIEYIKALAKEIARGGFGNRRNKNIDTNAGLRAKNFTRRTL